MITCTLGKHTYRIPSKWDDFTSEAASSFVRMSRAFDMFETGKMDFSVLRISVVAALLELDVRRIRKQNDTLAENVYRLSEYLGYPYAIQENEDGSRTVSLRIVLRNNLLPDIKGFQGYRFSVSREGMVDCSMTAEQYVEALPLADLYTKTRNTGVLDSLFKVLYGSGKGAGKIPAGYKLAVYYNFRGILEWIRLLPDYRLIYSVSGSRHGGSNPLGLSSSVFTLSKSGYGTLQEIRALDLFSYLGALVQLNIDGILSLRSAGLKPNAIAEKMNLPIEMVLPYITVADNAE